MMTFDLFTKLLHQLSTSESSAEDDWINVKATDIFEPGWFVLETSEVTVVTVFPAFLKQHTTLQLKAGLTYDTKVSTCC